MLKSFRACAVIFALFMVPTWANAATAIGGDITTRKCVPCATRASNQYYTDSGCCSVANCPSPSTVYQGTVTGGTGIESCTWSKSVSVTGGSGTQVCTYSSSSSSYDTCVIGSLSCNSGYYMFTSSSCRTCGSNAYYCTGNSRYSVSSGYYSTGGTSTTRTGQSTCGGNAYYCSSGVRHSVSSGYYSTGGTSTTRTGQTICPVGSYCTSGVKTACPAGTYNTTTGATSCDTAPFRVTTTTSPGTFSFSISAAGTFYVNWGDGEFQTITKTSTGATTYSHTYSSTSARTIGIAGTATAYTSGTPAISFKGNTKVAGIAGSLSTIFPTLNGSNKTYMFSEVFSGCTNLSGSIPSTLFSSLSGTFVDNMFSSTFAGCSKLTGEIPGGLFGNVTGGASNMFYGTFNGCSGLTSIGSGLFKNVTSASGSGSFHTTFKNCTGLTSIPSGHFSGLTGSAGTSAFHDHFSGCTGLKGAIPANLFGNLSGASGTWAFAGMFGGCTGLTSVPSTLFSKISASENRGMFSGTFAGCSGLTGYINANLFKTITGTDGDSTTWSNTFGGCTSMSTTCPAGTYWATTTGHNYTTMNGVAVCLPCSNGSYTTDTNNNGSSSAAATENVCYINISAGYRKSSSTGSTATQCDTGTYSVAHKSYYNSADSCTNCSGATYQDTKGASSCKLCPSATSGWSRGTGTGWTSYTSCYQSRTAKSANANCASGTLRQYGASASTWGSTVAYTTIGANAGAYVSGTTCNTCEAGYYCTGGTAARAACSGATQYQDTTGQTSCKTVSSGWYKSSNSAQAQCPAGYQNGTAASSQSNCVGTFTKTGTQVNGSTPVNCSSVTSWNACTPGTCTYQRNYGGTLVGSDCTPTNCTRTPKTVSANAGAYVSGAACNVCEAGYYCTGGTANRIACTVGSYTSQPGQTACVACGDGADWGKTTTAVGQTGCNADCSNRDIAKGYKDSKWNTNNTVTDLCTPNACVADYFLENNECKLCSSFANGLYPHSPLSGTSGGRDACFAYRSDLNGYYIKSEYDETATECAPGYFSYYNPDNKSAVVHYGETYKCSTCADNTYSTGGAAECTACPENYTTYGEKTSIQACHITCRGGTYLANAGDGECAIVGAGYWAPLARVPYGSVGVRNKCDTGTTIGYGPGADEIDDCGPILYVGDTRLYLRSEQKTHPALAFGINGITYYANMSTELKKMSDNIDSMLKIKMGDMIYTAYDDSGEFYVGPATPGITISPNLVATTIAPSSTGASVGVTQWSATLSDNTTVAGTAMCSATTATNGDVSADGFEPENSGAGCWCRLYDPAQSKRWVFASSLGDTCSDKCAFICANNMRGTSAKNITYRSHLYGTSGIATE